MSSMINGSVIPETLLLGVKLNSRVPHSDQLRQRAEVVEILQRFTAQPGVVLADEVGMGKTFVALAVAHSVAVTNRRGPVIVMCPANLIDKWVQDLRTFCEFYLDKRAPAHVSNVARDELLQPQAVRYGVARHSVDLLKLLDDRPRERCHMIFLAQGAMSRSQSDKWVRLALIAEALRRHGRGNAKRLIQVKQQIHRFLAELLRAIGEERATHWGDEVWQELLRTHPAAWKDIYNRSLSHGAHRLTDDPVPKLVTRTLHKIDLYQLADALKQMPIRARGGDKRVSDRLTAARKALRVAEEELWKALLSGAQWRSPLLVLDEAHHLKNPAAMLARQLQSPETDRDLRTGDGALAGAFDHMLFLTATPFQLGHLELVRVLERFGDVRWDATRFGPIEQFRDNLATLSKCLTDSQRAAIALRRAWSRLSPEDYSGDADTWWADLLGTDRDMLTHTQRAVVSAFETAKECRAASEKALRPWIVRHNKENYWPLTTIPRRRRQEGIAIVRPAEAGGLPIPPEQLLPFFLAARSAANQGRDLLGDALCSSFEAFRFTRQSGEAGTDEQDSPLSNDDALLRSRWYLKEFDRTLESQSGRAHPKVSATIKKAVDLWEAGEKVLIFAFYRRTCQALRIHISREIEGRIEATVRRRLAASAHETIVESTDRLIERIQQRFFDDPDSPGRKAVDSSLKRILAVHSSELADAQFSADEVDALIEVMRRFLRVATTLARFFPVAGLDSLEPDQAVEQTLDHADGSGVSWRAKFEGFIDFLATRCSSDERALYLEAARRTQTGGIRVDRHEAEDVDRQTGYVALANVQVATGVTRREMRARLMRAFNTPFFPDILVCSEVMGEGVDLQRVCRHVIHHDLAWNPSAIEQRTGRVDRIGCKAQGTQSINVFLPYIAGAADERQFRVMSEREQWFRVVMGQDEVGKLITPETDDTIPLPKAITEDLSFDLGLASRSAGAAHAQ